MAWVMHSGFRGEYHLLQCTSGSSTYAEDVGICKMAVFYLCSALCRHCLMRQHCMQVDPLVEVSVRDGRSPQDKEGDQQLLLKRCLSQ